MKFTVSKSFAIIGIVLMPACTPSPPVEDYASENTISLRYSAYDFVPTLTAEAREKTIKHCAKFGKFANYKGGNALNTLTAEEIHTFTCDEVKMDDGAILAGQNRRPDYSYVGTTVIVHPN